ncbi:MAG: hypothetical protein LBD20_10410 [Spirochaetaceae bacterium]|nr:hypothetical protein [Spirochaetaceae bacterium]
MADCFSRHGGRWEKARRGAPWPSYNSVTTLYFDKLKNRHGWRHGCRWENASRIAAWPSKHRVTTRCFDKLKNRHGWRFLSQRPLLSLVRFVYYSCLWF